jgi:hypothetical protein
VGNYVIANPFNLGNFMIADSPACLDRPDADTMSRRREAIKAAHYRRGEMPSDPPGLADLTLLTPGGTRRP